MSLACRLAAALVAVVALPVAAVAAAAGDDDCVLCCPTRPGPFGQPQVDKDCVTRCLRGETGPRPDDQRRPSALRFSGAWDANERFRAQRPGVDPIVAGIPDPAFVRWVRTRVLFDRVSRPGLDSLATAKPGVITIYDPFWSATRARRTNVLVFELGKVLWYERINPGSREARPPRQIEFETFYWQHQATIEAMRFAPWRGESLGELELGDLDSQSWFAMACRVALFGLEPPADPLPAYSRAQWARIVRDWPTVRAWVKQYVGVLLAERARP